MIATIGRIDDVAVLGGMQVLVRWRDETASLHVDLAGWIGTGGAVLAPLKRPEIFARAVVGDYGASLTWDGGEGDLSIDAHHLRQIALAQAPFRVGTAPGRYARDWQARVGLSNQEAASLLGIVPSTWNAYKAGRALPRALGLLMQASERDPLILQAHYRPRTRGRPRRAAG